jgi:hypothetical protein
VVPRNWDRLRYAQRNLVNRIRYVRFSRAKITNRQGIRVFQENSAFLSSFSAIEGDDGKAHGLEAPFDSMSDQEKSASIELQLQKIRE